MSGIRAKRETSGSTSRIACLCAADCAWGLGAVGRSGKAVRRAEEERPGAVHLELPEDVAREPVSCPPPSISFYKASIPTR